MSIYQYELRLVGNREYLQMSEPYLLLCFVVVVKQLNFYLEPSNFSSVLSRFQAAAEFAKTHLAEALRRQLLTYERERDRDREKDKDEKKEKGGSSYPSILEQQILTLDREMLDKLSANYNEAGLYLSCTLAH